MRLYKQYYTSTTSTRIPVHQIKESHDTGLMQKQVRGQFSHGTQQSHGGTILFHRILHPKYSKARSLHILNIIRSKTSTFIPSYLFPAQFHKFPAANFQTLYMGFFSKFFFFFLLGQLQLQWNFNLKKIKLMEQNIIYKCMMPMHQYGHSIARHFHFHRLLIKTKNMNI